MFGRTTLDAVRLPYQRFVKPGVRFSGTISSIDPLAKRVTTERGNHEADFLVVALGADFSDFEATPGLADTTEFYTVAGAFTAGREILPTFSGRALLGGGDVTALAHLS